MMTNTVMKPVWAGATFRLEPSRLPQHVSYALRDASAMSRLHWTSAVLSCVKSFHPAACPSPFALPARAFKGVAARAIDHGNGEVTVTLELYHEDPDLCIPLLVAHDLCDIAADWRHWAETFRIPMLMVEADGVARPLEEHLGEIRANVPKQRRRHSYFAERRPRFLVRRTTGSLGVVMKISGKEIIARS